ncbi:amino acid--tRNA ligase-related protein, partial [Priestia megaterium]|uniref:amino acid--tRNA ligase-related protein n=1 Tax=Priestia megaterium TaxID=1404 RepID=UPI002E258F6F
MFNRVKMGNEIRKRIGELLDENEFLDVERGILRKRRGEGGGDYVVLRGVEEGEFYGLRESREIFK